MGEVVLRGNTVMAGYLDDPEATAEAFRGGWFHSGDAAVVHPDGRLELRDRFKDVIISGGENISTIEVEQALARHPSVLECAVVGIPDDFWGERPKAFVELREGAEAPAEELIAFCREQLAGFKCPDSVEYCACRGRARGRSRSTCCASASGRGASAASTEAPWRPGMRADAECGDETAAPAPALARGSWGRLARERGHRLRPERRHRPRGAAARAEDDASARCLDADAAGHAADRGA